MNIKSLPGTTLFLAGLILGGLFSRLWMRDLSGGILTNAALFSAGILIGAVGGFAWARSRRVEREAPPVEDQSPAIAPSPVTASPAAPAPPMALGRHLVLVRSNKKWTLRLQDWWRYEFVELTIGRPHEGLARAGVTTQRRLDGRAWLSSLAGADNLATILFVLSLGVYAFTRLFALEQFPIYFFTDEAIHPALAAELIQRGFRDAHGDLFPTYFQNGLYWNLSLSVYIHAFTVFFFGESVLVTRLTSVVMTLFGAAAIGLIMKLIFKIKWWWIAVLFLTITPAWFLHSRTAFETAMMVSLYSWFLLCYLLYRYRSPKFLFPALIFGAATFYSYAIGQAVMVASGILFLVLDIRYHLRQWRTGFWGIGLLALLVLPYVRFRAQNPDVVAAQLRALDSYWLQSIPLANKVERFLSTYLNGLSSEYWFLPNEHDLVRHRMKDYGNVALWVLPFFLLGILVCLRNVKSAAHRAILIALLAAPVGGALADILITRALLFVVPASMLATLGFNVIVSWVKSQKLQLMVALVSFVFLSFFGVAMLRDALSNGPTWYTNYGLFGMQWGAKQLFEEAIPEYTRTNSTGQIYVTPTWANGTDTFLRFFKLDLRRVKMYNVDWFTAAKRAINPNDVIVMTREEYDRARASNKFKSIGIERTLKYPDGTDGFFFAHLVYVDNLDAVLAAELEARRQLVTETVMLNGEAVQIAHSRFDMGNASAMFDGDAYTLARGLEANPLILDFQFLKPREVHSLAAHFATMNFQWTIRLYPNDTDPPTEYTETYKNLSGEPQVEIRFERGPALVSRIRLEVLSLDAVETTHIHVRELNLK